MSSGAGYSNVGSRTLYEAGDQRNAKREDLETAERYKEGNANSHQAQDSKDNRTIANKLASEVSAEDKDDRSEETKLSQKDSTLPALSHGNAPSKGAKIDQELKEDDERRLAEKGIK